jgi:hypothetical protein
VAAGAGHPDRTPEGHRPGGDRLLASRYAGGWRPRPHWLLKTVWQFICGDTDPLNVFDPPLLEGEQLDVLTYAVDAYVEQIR